MIDVVSEVLEVSEVEAKGEQTQFDRGVMLALTMPSLEYRYAFDLCAVEAHNSGGPALVVASEALYARELLKRIVARPVTLVPLGNWLTSADRLESVLGIEVEAPDVRPLENVAGPVPLIICAEPVSPQVFGALYRLLQPGGRLCMISPGRLAPFIPHDDTRHKSLGWRQTKALLAQQGFAWESRHGFHGPVSVFWSYAFRLSTLLGRSDLADRCLYRMHETFMTAQTCLTTLNLALVSKANGDERC